jgi:nitrite reductase/ring-hydroxylating ferredoxin subunit/uncharacterized membrane protein
MAETQLQTLANAPWLDTVGKPLAQAVKALFDNAGPAGRTLKNLLHGTWLGHPVHPIFTDLPLGAWTTAIALDAQEAITGDAGYGRAADVALAVGLAGAVGAAVTGLNDWSETDGQAKRQGLLHGLLNITATSLVATGFGLRRGESRATGRVFAVAGYGLALASAYLGGDLVYEKRIGVTHAAVAEPETFTPVLDSAKLGDEDMQKATIEDASFLLVRQHAKVCALSHSCAHMGGPLSEGTLKEGSVVCPWHGSEFALEDGRVLNGPAAEPQPCFEARDRNGLIEVGPPLSTQ